MDFTVAFEMSKIGKSTKFRVNGKLKRLSNVRWTRPGRLGLSHGLGQLWTGQAGSWGRGNLSRVGGSSDADLVATRTQSSKRALRPA